MMRVINLKNCSLRITDTRINKVFVTSTDASRMIVTDVSSITEEECKQIVESARIKKSWASSISTVYINYAHKGSSLVGKYTETAHDSFLSLLEKYGIEVGVDRKMNGQVLRVVALIK